MKKLIFLFLFGLFSLNLSAKLPIVRAIEAGDLDEVERLIDEVGVDLNILVKREDYTETLLQRAVHKDKPEIIDLLIEKFKEKNISIDKMGTSKESALMYACSRGMFKYVEILINGGANVNFDNGEGVTPFMCVAYYPGKLENGLNCCSLLKKAGANLSLDCNDLDYMRKNKRMWSFVNKNMTFLCKLKYWLWRALPDEDNSN